VGGFRPSTPSSLFSAAGQWKLSGWSVVRPDDYAVFKMERFMFMVEDWSRSRSRSVWQCWKLRLQESCATGTCFPQ
jgi:hypothetical protein